MGIIALLTISSTLLAVLIISELIMARRECCMQQSFPSQVAGVAAFITTVVGYSVA